MIGLGRRLLAREFNSGELRLLLAALAVAVTTVTTVGFFTDRVRLALESEATQLLGGDLLIVADHQLPREIRAEASARSLAITDTLSFPSMVMGEGGGAQLADVKAAADGYPLRGRLATADRRGVAGSPRTGGPAPGTAWVDERLAAALDLEVGQAVRLGRTRLVVAAILTFEPDRGVNFFTLAPRLLMHLDDVPATGLVQAGSRLTYRFLVAGGERAVAGYRDWVRPRLGRGERLEDAAGARPEIRTALDRAQRFLGLATLLTVVLSAVAAALAARRYLQRHLDSCAVMRCLGATQGEILRLHAAQFAWLALVAAAIGCGAGYAAHFMLVEWLVALLALPLPAPGWLPLMHGGAVAAVLLFGFAYPPLFQLARVPTLRVLRRELGAPRPSLLGGYFLGVVALAGLMFMAAGDARLGAWVIGGFAVALAAFWAVARAAVALAGGARRGGGSSWRQGLASLKRHAAASTVQIVALALGLTALLLLTVTRSELLAAWARAAPADAPDHFVVNIQPDQRAGVAALLAAGGIDAELSPMVRGRLTHVGGRQVSAAAYPDDERAQRLVEREFNLSWRAALPPGNRIAAGSWFPEDAAGQGLASVEEGLARTLGIALGDELRFQIAGREVAMRVTSLRRLDWDSMRVNFFVLAPPGVLDGDPASYITSFHLGDGRSLFGRELIASFPNLTLIDLRAVLAQVQAVIGQVARAVQFIFLFTLLAGGIVLLAALVAAFDERRYELAVLRALGATRRQLRRTLTVELAAVGGIAGAIAGGGALALGQVLARQVFQLDMAPNWLLPPLAAAGGAILSVAVGWLAARRLLASPPLLALRAGV